MRRVAVYARVSTEHEAQLSALENQIQYYDDLLEKHPDWQLYDRYIDEGITGTSTKKRPNFMRMMSDAERGCFDLIITREVSRFARNTVDALQETRKLKRMGIEVYFTEDHIWTMDDNDGELKLTLMATLAQNESRKTSQRVKAGQKISFENGVFYGTGNILGYDKVGKDMIVNEEQAEIVRLIYKLYLKGDGLKTIKFELERIGYLTATGKKNWDCATISRILKNSFYCGIIEYRKFYIPDYLEQKAKRNTGQVEKVIVEGRHVPLVSKEDFNKVQEKLNSRKIETSNGEKVFGGKKQGYTIWARKLECKCGSKFNRSKFSKNNKGEVTYCYRCYNQIRTGSIQTRLKKGLSIENVCDSVLIAEWKLEVISKILFDRLWTEKDKITIEINNILDKAIKQGYDNDYEKEIDINNRKIESLVSKNNNALDAFLSQIITKENYVKKKKEIDDEINLLKTRNEELEILKNKPKVSKLDKLEIIKKTIEESLNFDKDNISDELIENLIEKIIVYENRFVYKLKLNGEMKEDDKEPVLLTSLVVTKDQIKKIVSKMNKRIKSYDTIHVDVYI